MDLILYKSQGVGIFQKQWYNEGTFLNFEFLSLPAPKEYMKIIDKKYYNYEVIKKGGGDHDYPMYRKMESDYIKGIGGKLFYQYTINRNDLSPREIALSDAIIRNNLQLKSLAYCLCQVFTHTGNP